MKDNAEDSICYIEEEEERQTLQEEFKEFDFEDLYVTEIQNHSPETTDDSNHKGKQFPIRKKQTFANFLSYTEKKIR